MKEQHLLIFAYDFPPSTGGIARLCYEIASHGVKYFASVTVLTRGKGGRAVIDSEKDFTIKELPSRRISCEWAAYRYLRKRKRDGNVHVICGLWHPEGMLCKLAGIPNIHILAHGGELQAGSSGFRRKLWLAKYAKRVLQNASTVMANSDFTARLVTQIAPKATVRTVKLGVDTDFFSPGPDFHGQPNGNLHIVTVSRMQRHKGHLTVLEAIAGLPEDLRIRLQWKIAGTGSYSQVVQSEITKLGLTEIVEMVGFVPDNELPDFYRKADVFILFSQQDPESHNVEGFGLVFLEAQACGVPVIGANTGGIPDAIVEGEGGWLLAPDDVEGLQRLLEKLIQQPELLETQGRRARERTLSEATWGHYIQNLISALK